MCKKLKIVISATDSAGSIIIRELENHFLVDANLPIIVDKELNFKIGDYVTVGFPHDIQAHLVDKGIIINEI